MAERNRLQEQAQLLAGEGKIVESIAAGDRRALDALFERTHRLVFTLIFRIVSNRQTAEEVTQDLYHDVWRHAARYDAANGSVLGWVMNQARSRAIDRLRFDQRKKRVEPSSDAALLVLDMPDYRDVLEVREQSRTLRHALSVLTQGEREAIESAFFGDSTYVEVAARLKQPLATIKTRIRSALHKLRQAMAEGSKETVSSPAQTKCDLTELVCAYAAGALPAGEMLVAESHLPACWQCRRELEMLLPTIESFVFWPKDLLRPTASLLKRLAQVMTEERIFRQERLTIGALASRLAVPEERLRRAINEGLGYRNFNAFINHYRLEDAKAALSDPSQSDVPVLTIAMDAGFQSLGPFNRAFKADTGMTPTEYRRKALGAAG